MAFQQDSFYYNKQITSYILQFMAIFYGIQVLVGKNATRDQALVPVPIHYGNQDRVVAAILGGNTQNAPISLPRMSAYVRGFTYAAQQAKGTGTSRRNAYVPVGGLIPEDIEVVYQRMPTPYLMDIDLSIFASNNEQHHQILEQIMPLFDPTLQIQVSDALFDMKKITSVELMNGPTTVSPYPSNAENRIIQSTLSFRILIQIDIPAIVRKNFIEKIYLRIGTIADSDVTNQEIIDDLNGQGIPYELIISDTDLPFK